MHQSKRLQCLLISTNYFSYDCFQFLKHLVFFSQIPNLSSFQAFLYNVRYIVLKLLLHRLLVWLCNVFLRYFAFIVFSHVTSYSFSWSCFLKASNSLTTFLKYPSVFDVSFLFDRVAYPQLRNLEYLIAPKLCWSHLLHPTRSQYHLHHHHRILGHFFIFFHNICQCFFMRQCWN